MIKRGDICWHDLGPIVDRGPAKRRPVVVVQSDNVTRSRIGTIVVVSMTSASEKAGIPGNVFVPAALSGLAKDSVAVVSQIMAIDRDLISDPIGEIPPTLMRDVDAGLRRVLNL